jgi:hypothetical protein
VNRCLRLFYTLLALIKELRKGYTVIDIRD